MDEPIGRIRRDLQIIQSALGLDIWTRGDVRRGYLGTVAGGAASLLLALWMFYGGEPVAGLLGYVIALQAIHVLKAMGFRKNAAPSAGTMREIGFFNRYYLIGAVLIGCYYFWGDKHGIEPQVLFASTVVIAGMWYAFYAISAPARGTSMVGAATLIVGGFILPEARGGLQMFGWLGVVACVGCWSEAVLLLVGLQRAGRSTNPPENPLPGNAAPVPCPPQPPAPIHVAD
jgi:hypothetical protein